MSLYKGFKSVTYCVAQWADGVTEPELRKQADWLQKYVGIDKVYLETFRGSFARKEQILMIKKVLKEYGIETIVHMIIGLPGESRQMILETAGYIAQSGVQGIKLQLLHVLKDTDLADDYEKGYFTTLTLDEYIDILADIIEILPPGMVIHRITGDAPKKLLVSPMWSADKKRVLNTINKEFEKRDVRQGRKYVQ